MAKTVEERNAILERALIPYLNKGWILQSRDSRGEVWAQLTLPAKKYGTMSRLMFGLFLLLKPRRDKVLTLTVNERGKVKKRMRTA